MAESPQVISVLHRKRKIIVHKFSSFQKYIETFSDTFESVEEQKKAAKLIELGDRITAIEQSVVEFDDIQKEIELVVDENELDDEFDYRETVEKQYREFISNAKSMYDAHNQKVGRINHQDDNVSVKSESRASTEGVRLPTINLPKFQGHFDKWLEFKDIFQSLINNNESINKTQKFHYLRASLEGQAKQIISYLEFKAENYPIAWKLLCERYDNKRFLIQNHIKAIFDIESIHKESSERIRFIYDNVSKHLSSLKQLGEAVEGWDTLLIYVLSSKLDSNTIQEWEKQTFDESSINFDIFQNFLKNRADLLESLESRKAHKGDKDAKPGRIRGLFSSNEGERVKKYSCNFCQKDHSIFYCNDFLKLSIKDRMSKVKSLRLCFNCLRKGHTVKECRSNGCRICKSKHNTVLHESSNAAVETVNSHVPNSDDIVEPIEPNTTCTLATAGNVLLSTASVYVYDIHNKRHTARVLLDCGSQSSFMSERLWNILQIPKQNANIAVSGINNATTPIRHKCPIRIHSVNNQFSVEVTCFIIKNITSDLPCVSFDADSFKIPQNIKLADPSFNVAKQIDLLLGADIFWTLLSVGQIHLGNNMPILQKTRLGWIAAGPVTQVTKSFTEQKSACYITKITIQEQLAKFWEVEEVQDKPCWSHEEIACEKHFKKHTKIARDGRYVVSLPFSGNPQLLGESKFIAEKRYLQLEKRLNSSDNVKTLYLEFLNEYERLGHMERVPPKEVECSDSVNYYMPHHSVLKDSSTTKLRVVFNASAPTTSGISLNNLLMTGPVVQDELIAIILRFRIPNVVLSGDIKMMYRQILIDPDQTRFQRIIWKPNPDDTAQTYELKTVTYGTTPASFLATRCLKELADEVKDSKPQVSYAIEHDMYMDDLLTGCEDEREAKALAIDIYRTLLTRGFELRKWRSNCVSIPDFLEKEELSNQPLEFSISKDENCKILGLCWNHMNDVLTFKISIENFKVQVTKRSILSKISTIYDPLGLLSPCIIIVKILLQKIWSEKLGWDESLPQSLHKIWTNFIDKLPQLNNLKIPRKVVCDRHIRLEIHAFSDASESAYGACIYMKSQDITGSVVNLYCAKSKVAPLKTLTIPRLELLAALLSTRLVHKLLKSISVKIDKIYCWTDSTIVLAWLKTEPNLLKQFINNRVAEIQKFSKNWEWRHVSTNHNPADLLSRGVSPDILLNNEFWWHGPEWVSFEPSDWPNSSINLDSTFSSLPEIKKSLTMNHTKKFNFERFSKLDRMKRSFAYVLRFVRNCRNLRNRIPCPLQVEEIESAFKILVKFAQQESFPEEYHVLSKNKSLSSNTRLLSLNPFLDSEGIMRVGGRLANSNFEYSKIHPIILCPHHHLTKLLFRQEHERLLHAGPQQLLAHTREKVWTISGRNLARITVKNCVTCARFAKNTLQPLMGNLPKARVTPTLPFTVVGVDYCGPFLMKDRRGRGCRTTKCWLAVFVCFSTRAVHLELVTSLDTESFMKAFQRLIYRRGKPSDVYSDNGSNFVGANNELLDLGEFLKSNTKNIYESAAKQGIKWHFIPVNSPNFGGLWEAGVKSAKHHLKRVLKNVALTFEDFQTLLVQIEGVLNSRPISPLTSDPSDLNPLTPAHLLLGRAMMTLPEGDIRQLPLNRLSLYQHLTQIKQHFWSRWSKEYVSELQQRIRWKQNQGNLQVGQLVLIKTPNAPALQWRLARVTELHPGQDGISRVASLQTSTENIQRALSRLCPLPVYSEVPVENLAFQGGGPVGATHRQPQVHEINGNAAPVGRCQN